MTLTLVQDHRSARKKEKKNFGAKYLTKFSVDLVESGVQLRLVNVVNLIFFLYRRFNIHGRENY